MKLKENYPLLDKKYLTQKFIKKEYFNKIAKIILKDKKKNISILDVGCASGDFLYYFNSKKKFNCYGVDFSKILIKEARKKVTNATFEVGNISNLKIQKKFDYCTCLGVLNIFDDYKKILNKLLKLVKTNGKLIIFTNINNNNFNVILRYQVGRDNKWYSGLNTFSKKQFKDFIEKKKKIKKVEFIKHKIGIKIPKNKKNLNNSWTLKVGREKLVTNGTDLIQRQNIIIISL